MGVLSTTRVGNWSVSWVMVGCGGITLFGGTTILQQNDPDEYAIGNALLAVVLIGALVSLAGVTLKALRWD
ncbi:hypothetical protein [Halococcus sp. IIIV-5B]|uniref:hypothetical protein n=1 Tax=Halococcus sp. IIIV-5B TaxID=2321230 RepID=UPI000E73D18C|nr:hypothetical protein [Halococcus sp. IIIV-5B]RJT07938.1 hypothetical protein D3261_00895 [Halococcus sp. IIIV-5B]